MSEKQVLYKAKDGDDGLCYYLDYFIDELDENKSVQLLEMEPDREEDTRWCKYESDFIEDGSCGISQCGYYKPLNGLRGKCIHKTYTLKETGRVFLLTKDELKEIVNDIHSNTNE